MPLKKGKSKKTISKNIKELVDTFKKKGKIGSSNPKNIEDARKQAAAIAYSKASESIDFNSIVSDIIKETEEF